MGGIERQTTHRIEKKPNIEILDPRHFYAAYIFDQANEREEDIGAVIQEAKHFGYLVRYWWLSDAMELQGSPDRLIICVHHPSDSEDAGINLYDALKEKDVTWDDLESAVVDEYRYLGNPVQELGDFCSPYGNWLFPQAVTEERRLPYPEDAMLLITSENVREELRERLGREVTDVELNSVLIWLRKALDNLGWTFYLDEALQKSTEARWVERRAEEPSDSSSDQ
ncbi:hypothetical protein ACFLV7_08575 [Chloroflexota bacterium]